MGYTSMISRPRTVKHQPVLDRGHTKAQVEPPIVSPPSQSRRRGESLSRAVHKAFVGSRGDARIGPASCPTEASPRSLNLLGMRASTTARAQAVSPQAVSPQAVHAETRIQLRSSAGFHSRRCPLMSSALSQNWVLTATPRSGMVGPHTSETDQGNRSRCSNRCCPRAPPSADTFIGVEMATELATATRLDLARSTWAAGRTTFAGTPVWSCHTSPHARWPISS